MAENNDENNGKHEDLEENIKSFYQRISRKSQNTGNEQRDNTTDDTKENIMNFYFKVSNRQRSAEPQKPEAEEPETEQINFKNRIRSTAGDIFSHAKERVRSIREEFTTTEQPSEEENAIPENSTEFAQRIISEYTILGGIDNQTQRNTIISDKRLDQIAPKEGLTAELAENQNSTLKALSILIKTRVLERLVGKGKNNLSNRKKLAEGELNGLFYENGLPLDFQNLNTQEQGLIMEALSDCAAPRENTDEQLQSYMTPGHNGSRLAVELDEVLQSGTLANSDSGMVRGLLLKIQRAHRRDNLFSLRQYVESYEKNEKIVRLVSLGAERYNNIQKAVAELDSINTLLSQMERVKKDQAKVLKLSKQLDYTLNNLSSEIRTILSEIEPELPQEKEEMKEYIKNYAPIIFNNLNKEKALYEGDIKNLFITLFNKDRISRQNTQQALKIAQELGIGKYSELQAIQLQMSAKEFMGEEVLEDSEKLTARELLFQINLKEEQSKGTSGSRAKLIASATSKTCDDMFDGTIDHLKAAENEKILRVKGAKTTWGRVIPWTQILETEIKKLNPFKSIKTLPLELSETEIDQKIESGELDYDSIPKLISVLDDIILGRAPDYASKNALYDYTILGFRERLRKYWLQGIFEDLEHKIIEIEKDRSRRDKLDELIKEETEKTFEIINDAFGKATAYKTSGEKDKEKRETEEKERAEKKAKKEEKLKTGIDKFSHLNSKTATAANVLNTGLNVYNWWKNRKKK